MSRKERLQEIEDLIMELAPCKSLRKYHPQHYEFFRDLFHHHPDAERKKVDAIVDISLDTPGGARLGLLKQWHPRLADPRRKVVPVDAHGGPVFRIHYSTTKSDSISWRKCM